MGDKMDMSLDDIIKATKTSKGGRGGGGAGRRPGGARGGGGRGRGGMRRGGPPRNNRPRSNVSDRYMGNYSRGDPEGQWSHDMFVGGGGGGGVAPRILSGITTGGSGKLLVSNLDFGVSESDILELFSEFGNLKSAVVHFDRSGRSLGTAEVAFERRGDAVKAMKQYHGVPLDGRPMKIELAGSDRDMIAAAAVVAAAPLRRRSGGGGMPPRRDDRRRSGGRVTKPARGGGGGGGRGGRGGRGGGRGREPAPSKEKLDEEMDAYMKARS